ncbi:MAG: threonylcarbamoyl-AMP synthase [Clostridia bacterium]|nr:threonylcarbamoyl-AMP synthase [Clostridia bacterium]
MKNTLKLKTYDINNDLADIRTAAEILKNGGVVAIPTETVYGLAADAFNEDAVRYVYKAKGRPSDNPFIVHISSFEQIYSLAKEVPESAKKLAEKFWPGPLTIILPKRDEVPYATSGGLDTVAIRFPSHPVANKIIELSCPLAAPSANISGFPSPTAFEHVEADMMGRADAICDGGDCNVGVESTVISLATPVPLLCRPGGITLEQLCDVLGEVQVADSILNPMKQDESAPSPGMKYKHYSPKAQLTVVRGNFEEFRAYADSSYADAVMCFEGEEEFFRNKITVTFGQETDPLTQAQRLFFALRELDEKGADKVLVRSPSKEGVGLAVCNRLYRAAAFRFVDAFKRPIVGLTGPTGSGKGYVAAYLKNIGCYVADTDLIAREITMKGAPHLKVLAAHFGEDIITADGELDRKLLASRAFKDKASQELLNSLTHPEIIRISMERCIDALENGATAAVIDAPLLFECGADKLCNTVIAVTAPKEIRLQRIMQRDNISEEQALARMSVQHDDEFYTDKSEFSVRSYAPFDVEKELEPFVDKYLKAQVT